MRLVAVGDVVPHAGAQYDGTAVTKLCLKFTAMAQQQMPFLAPMIGYIARRVFHQPYPDVSELARAPDRAAAFAFVFDTREGSPIDGFEWDVLQYHNASIARWAKKIDA
jgi:hypothetical protein